MTKRLCFACDLKDDPELIEAYKSHHQADNLWPEITKSIRSKGILSMQIYLTGNRLFMIAEVGDKFDPQLAENMDRANEKVQEWEELMSTFQQLLPWAKEGQKWVEMELIFDLGES